MEIKYENYPNEQNCSFGSFWKWKVMKKDHPLTARLEKLAWHS